MFCFTHQIHVFFFTLLRSSLWKFYIAFTLWFWYQKHIQNHTWYKEHVCYVAHLICFMLCFPIPDSFSTLLITLFSCCKSSACLYSTFYLLCSFIKSCSIFHIPVNCFTCSIFYSSNINHQIGMLKHFLFVNHLYKLYLYCKCLLCICLNSFFK